MHGLRRATLEDTTAIVDMGVRFIGTTGYAGLIPANVTAMTAFVESLLGMETARIFVAERGGTVVGMIGLFVYVHPMSGELTAVETFWWVEPEHRGQGLRLLKLAEQWAREAGAVSIQMIAPTDAVGRLYERLQYRFVESSYMKTL